jgi:AcrR family transcriptional regulator
MAAAARQVYLDQGAEALSLRTLADALGISHTLPYRYFRNKEALLAHLRCDAVGRFHAWVVERDPGPEADPLPRLRSLFDAYIGYARRHPAEYRLIFASEQPPPDRYPALLAARRGMFDFAMAVVQQCIDAGLTQGDAREIAHAYWVTLHGLMTLHVANQLVHGLRFEQLAPALLERLLGPMQAPVPAASARMRSKENRS